jgi:hypothetical protein
MGHFITIALHAFPPTYAIIYASQKKRFLLDSTLLMRSAFVKNVLETALNALKSEFASNA